MTLSVIRICVQFDVEYVAHAEYVALIGPRLFSANVAKKEDSEHHTSQPKQTMFWNYNTFAKNIQGLFQVLQNSSASSGVSAVSKDPLKGSDHGSSKISPPFHADGKAADGHAVFFGFSDPSMEHQNQTTHQNDAIHRNYSPSTQTEKSTSTYHKDTHHKEIEWHAILLGIPNPRGSNARTGLGSNDNTTETPSQPAGFSQLWSPFARLSSKFLNSGFPFLPSRGEPVAENKSSQSGLGAVSENIKPQTQIPSKD